MIDKIKVKKGLDLRLKGVVAPDAVPVDLEPTLVAVCPDDFPGFQPKPEVREGDVVEAFQPLLRDKEDERVKLVSPVAGVVKAIVRGERRKIERVVVEATDGPRRRFEGNDFAALLMASGLWAMMRQRPYDIVPRTDARPRDIFVSVFDSAPLAVNAAPSADDLRLMEAGVEALKRLTDGRVYVSRRPGAMPDLKGACMIDVEGPHPAGNAGTQIAAIAPVNKGETVWTLSANVLREAGRLALEGYVDSHVTVAITGPEALAPKLVRTVAGAAVAPLLEGETAGDRHIRIIAGNVLCGRAIASDGFLRYPYRQLTLMREGDDVDEFMGWASLSPSKMSWSRTFPAALLRRRRFSPDARVLGGHRAMIMSGVYESLFPMDILPEYLLKAMIAKDIEQMEALGAYEVAPEDFALAEYADPSKLELQRIVRESLDFLRKNN